MKVKGVGSLDMTLFWIAFNRWCEIRNVQHLTCQFHVTCSDKLMWRSLVWNRLEMDWTLGSVLLLVVVNLCLLRGSGEWSCGMRRAAWPPKSWLSFIKEVTKTRARYYYESRLSWTSLITSAAAEQNQGERKSVAHMIQPWVRFIQTCASDKWRHFPLTQSGCRDGQDHL